MEGNIVSLIQHDCYGSLLQKTHIYIACIELLVFSVGMGGEYACSSFVAKEDHNITEIMTGLALDFVLSEGGLYRSLASLLFESHLNPVTRYSLG